MVNLATGRCASGQRDVIDQRECGEDSDQDFRFESTGPDIRIVETSTGQVLDVEDGSDENGASIVPRRWNGGPSQRWYVRPVGSGYEIVSVNSGKCITVRDRDDVDRRHLYQSTCSQRLTQVWGLN